MIVSCLGIAEQFTVIAKGMVNFVMRYLRSREWKKRLLLPLRGLSGERLGVRFCLGSRTPKCSTGSPYSHKLLPKADTSFPRHLLKPLDPNSPMLSWLLNPAFLLFTTLGGKSMQMLYFGKMLGMTEKALDLPRAGGG